jgi:hypothetical protein
LYRGTRSFSRSRKPETATQRSCACNRSPFRHPRCHTPRDRSTNICAHVVDRHLRLLESFAVRPWVWTRKDPPFRHLLNLRLSIPQTTLSSVQTSPPTSLRAPIELLTLSPRTAPPLPSTPPSPRAPCTRNFRRRPRCSLSISRRERRTERHARAPAFASRSLLPRGKIRTWLQATT